MSDRSSQLQLYIQQTSLESHNYERQNEDSKYLFTLQYLPLLIDFILIQQMYKNMNEGQTDSERPFNQQFITVNLQLERQMFRNTDDPTLPLFDQSSFKFDQDELAKIISFEDFQLIFRPFKNNPNCAKHRILAKVVRFSPLMFLPFLIMAFILIDKQAEDWVIMAFFYLFFLIVIIIFSLLFYLSYISKKVLRELHEFTKTIMHQQMEIQLKGKKIEPNILNWLVYSFTEPGIYSLTEEFTYFEIRSKHIKKDINCIKLYCKRPAMILESFSSSKDKPIFYQYNFQFDKDKLKRIISFAKFQEIIRPFSQSESYKRISFLLKCMNSLIFAPFVTLLPMLILIKRDYHNILIGLSVVILPLTSLWLQKKIGHSKTQAVLKLRDFCNEVSLLNKKYEITLHVREKENKYWTQTQKTLYCFEIKRK